MSSDEMHKHSLFNYAATIFLLFVAAAYTVQYFVEEGERYFSILLFVGMVLGILSIPFNAWRSTKKNSPK